MKSNKLFACLLAMLMTMILLGQQRGFEMQNKGDILKKISIPVFS